MATFVIYNTKGFHLYKTPNGKQWFDQERTAKAMHTRFNLGDDWKVASYDEWSQVDPDIQVRSVMNGQLVTIKASDRGNPALDPSMEGYWTF
jgi:hypothetical protein